MILRMKYLFELVDTRHRSIELISFYFGQLDVKVIG